MKFEPNSKRKIQDIRDLSWKELTHYLTDKGMKDYRVKQIFDWLYIKNINDFEQMKNLSAASVKALAQDFQIFKPRPIKKVESQDATCKVLFELQDGHVIETAYIPTKKRLTVCVSTQVGCKFGCAFCASGLGGFFRDLSCSEILNQILYANNVFNEQKVTNIVFMGIGEPLDNYDNVLKSIRIINDKNAIGIGMRRITISTCGLIPQMKRLAKEGLQVELAISLHGYDNSSRDKLMPVNRRYPFKKLIHSSQLYYQKTKRQITFEYVLIKDFTCSSEAVTSLKNVLKGFDCKLNLIPYNAISVFSYEPPSKQEIVLFQKELTQNQIHSTLRSSRGSDVLAACGQLRHKIK